MEEQEQWHGAGAYIRFQRWSEQMLLEIKMTSFRMQQFKPLLIWIKVI